MEGIIYKGIGGFYYVKTENGTMIECKPRGIFRKQGKKPLPGDRVLLAREAQTDYIDDILPRRNVMIRPAVANVDQLVIVVSTVEPVPSLLVIDKLTAYAIDLEVQPIIVITKSDLSGEQFLLDAYAKSNIPVVVTKNNAELDNLRMYLKDKLSVFCGNSGVGKSTLLNGLAPDLQRQVGDISQKLGRGRHTTREVEIFEVDGGLLADTPGFASFDLYKVGQIASENMQLCFPEIKDKIGQCKFSGCSHVSEPGCAVLEAVQAEEIVRERHNNYVTLFNQAKEEENRYS